MTRTRTALLVLVTVLAIAVGAALWHRLPANTDTFAPFDIRGGPGEHLDGRGLSGTVDRATITPLVVSPFGKRLTPVGTWVVVQAALQSGDAYATAQADLLVGPNTYRPTDRILGNEILQPGITDHRFWVFDVAPDALAAADSVVFRAWVGDGRLDSRLVVDIPLNGPQVERMPGLRVPQPVQAAS